MSQMQPMPQPHRKKDDMGKPAGAPSPQPTPRHIVVFPEPSETNASRVADILQAKRSRDARGRTTCTVMAATRAGDAAALQKALVQPSIATA